MTKKRLFSFILALVLGFTTMLTTSPLTAFAADDKPVAKVGDTEYATIDDAIANWTNGKTLTLLDNVTLSDTIVINSTEHHILNLSTFTMTAASGKNAFEIKAMGTGDSERYAITINADATNPGGIDAGKKAIVYYDYKKGETSGNDRPIIQINGGVFNASTSSFAFGSTVAGIHTVGTAARKCATINITGGTFNCSILQSSKGKLLISGGTFNYTVSSQGDSTAYRHISGGKFKTIGFMTGDAANKFGIGSDWENCKNGNYDLFLYVSSDGYLNVVKEKPDGLTIEATANYSAFNSYLQYSSAKDGLHYESLETVMSKASNIVCYAELDENNSTIELSKALTVDVTKTGSKLPMDKVVLTSRYSSFSVSYVQGNRPAELAAEDFVTSTAGDIYKIQHTGLDTATIADDDTIITEKWSLVKDVVAKIDSTEYGYISSALAAANAGDTIVLQKDVKENGFVLDKDVTIDLGGFTYTIDGTVGSPGTATNGLQLLKDVNVTIKNGTITSETAKLLIQNYANLTLDGVTLDGSKLAGTTPYTLSNNCGNVVIKDSTIIASANGFAFDVCDYASYTAPIVTVENSTIDGLIEMSDYNGNEFSGKIVDGSNTHTALGNYVQINNSIFPIYDYNITLNVSDNAIQAKDSITVEVVIDKEYYSLDYTFTYDNALFTCAEDTDNDGIIKVNCLTTGTAGVLATYNLTALNDITKVTTTDLTVNGRVLQHAIQSITDVESVVTGETEQVKISLDYEAEVKTDYVSGYTLVLVKGQDAGYAYNDVKMIYVNEYQAYAFLVEGNKTLEDVDLALSKADNCESITKSYDVNAEYLADGVIDLKDATAVFACYSLDFDVNNYLELFLRADVNNDYCVNYADVNVVTANYTK